MLDACDVSVGICCYNEEANIATLLDNLLTRQHLSPNSEILVICSGCTDKTPAIVAQYCEQDARVKLIVEKVRAGKAEAVNRILQTYNTDTLFLIPGDVVPAPFSLPQLLRKLRSHPQIGVVSGRPRPINRHKGFLGYLGHLLWRLHHRTLHTLNDLNLCTHATGELMVFKRGMVEHIPLNVVNEDAYIAMCAFLEGFLIKYCPDAPVYIKAPTNVVDYFRQRRRIIYGHHRVKHLTKYHTRNLESMFLFDPMQSVKIIQEEVQERPKDFPKFFLVVLFEFFVNVLAMIDVARRKDHTLWQIAQSTKTSR